MSVILTNMPFDQINDAMKTLCWLQVAPLREIVTKKIEAQSKEELSGGEKSYKLEASVAKHSAQDPVTYLDRLAVIFR